MSESPHLGLGYLAPAQAQKHVTVNEAFRRLDALVQLGVKDRDKTAPPPGPEEGDRHIVAVGATGSWDGQDGKIAAWLDGAWAFIRPKPGWIAFDAAEGDLVAFRDGAWVGAAAVFASLDAIGRLGIATSADAVNRLAVASAAALFTHAGAGVQVKLNKASAGDTASLIFQTGYSGRAECGLAGSDGFALKVSADGGAWSTALAADPATGAVDLPNTPTAQVDKFTMSGTWTKPAWAKRVIVQMVSGGSGGGSGALRASGVAASGGGGGAGGIHVAAELDASALPATVAVSVGAGGSGGAAVSAADAGGTAGAAGGSSAFGSFLRANNVNNSGGGGGTATTGAAGSAATSNYGLPPMPNILAGAGSTGAGAIGGRGPGGSPSAGGGGGGVSATNVFGAGGSSVTGGLGMRAITAVDIAGGTTQGAPGASPASPALGAILHGADGGSGGAGSAGGNGGAGGDGAIPGGGGGGGGAARNGSLSGKGGGGARGEVWVVSLR